MKAATGVRWLRVNRKLQALAFLRHPDVKKVNAAVLYGGAITVEVFSQVVYCGKSSPHRNNRPCSEEKKKLGSW